MKAILPMGENKVSRWWMYFYYITGLMCVVVAKFSDAINSGSKFVQIITSPLGVFALILLPLVALFVLPRVMGKKWIPFMTITFVVLIIVNIVYICVNV